MQVKIEEIQDKGLELDEPIPRAVIDVALEGTPGFSFGAAASKLRASFKKFVGRVLMKGSFTATVKAPCKRCVKDVLIEVPVNFDLNLVPQAPKSVASAR